MLRVHHALRGKERHDTAVPYRVKPFQEEIVVNGSLCRLVRRIAARFKGRVEDRHIPERYIRYGKVERAVERFFYLLEALHPYFLIRIEV